LAEITTIIRKELFLKERRNWLGRRNFQGIGSIRGFNQLIFLRKISIPPGIREGTTFFQRNFQGRKELVWGRKGHLDWILFPQKKGKLNWLWG